MYFLAYVGSSKVMLLPDHLVLPVMTKKKIPKNRTESMAEMKYLASHFIFFYPTCSFRKPMKAWAWMSMNIPCEAMCSELEIAWNPTKGIYIDSMVPKT